jgi:hypothetical protein
MCCHPNSLFQIQLNSYWGLIFLEPLWMELSINTPKKILIKKLHLLILICSTLMEVWPCNIFLLVTFHVTNNNLICIFHVLLHFHFVCIVRLMCRLIFYMFNKTFVHIKFFFGQSVFHVATLIDYFHM